MGKVSRSARQTTREVVSWFGPAVRAERERQGMTGGELATAAGTTQAAVSEVEHGVRSVSLAVAVRIVDALGVTLDSLRAHE